MSETQTQGAGTTKAPEKCYRCGTLTASKFCPECGNDMSAAVPGVIDNRKWGPGSKFKKLCTIPREYTEGGEEIDVCVNGVKLFGEMKLTAEEYDDIVGTLKRRKWQDFVSRHGDPHSPRRVNVRLPDIRGR